MVVRKTQNRRGNREKVEEKMGMTVSKHSEVKIAFIIARKEIM